MYIRVKNRWQNILDIVMIIIGTVIMGFAFSVFLEPNCISTGGFSGISMIINVLLSKIGINFLNASIIYFVLNIGLFLYAFRALGKKFAIKALIGIVSFSLAMQFFNIIPFAFVYEPIISAVYGGVIMGIGNGLVIRFGGSTGGGDMIACIVRKKKVNVSIGSIVLIIDVLVILMSLFVFSNGVEILPYTILAIGLASYCIDFINDGYKQVRAYNIITNKADILSEIIMKELSRGCTASSVTGMHSKENKTCLLCLVSKFQSQNLIRIVKNNDPDAFIFVTKVNDVVGKFSSTSEINKEMESLRDNFDNTNNKNSQSKKITKILKTKNKVSSNKDNIE